MIEYALVVAAVASIAALVFQGQLLMVLVK
jgi:hypothetical protein